MPPHVSNDIDPAHSGHPPVKDHNRIVIGTEVGDGLFAVSHGIDGIAILGKSSLQHGTERAVIFGHQRSHGEQTSTDRAIPNSPMVHPTNAFP
jgi:hypothetical protein